MSRQDSRRRWDTSRRSRPRQTAGRLRRPWYLICERLKSRRMLAVMPDTFEPNDTVELRRDAYDLPADFPFVTRKGDLVSSRIAQAMSQHSAIEVFGASNSDPTQQRQVRYNDNEPDSERAAAVDFVVPDDKGRYRIVVSSFHMGFTLKATIQAWQIRKRPNPTTSRNAERQKVLPPPASDCHSLPRWLSSPSRMVPNRYFVARYRVFGKRWRKKWRAGLVAWCGRRWQMASFEGSRNTPPARPPEFDTN